MGGATDVDTARYNFETSTQGWVNDSTYVPSTPFTTVGVSAAQHFAGMSSLAATIVNSPATEASYWVDVPLSPNAASPDFVIPPNTTITFHVYVPVDAPITWVYGYLDEGPNAPIPYRTAIGNVAVVRGGWNTLTIKTAVNVSPVVRLAVRFMTAASWSGTVYVDSVDW